MPTVVGVAFKKAGKIYDFGTKGLELTEGMSVVTQTVRGWKIGLVVTEPREKSEDEVIGNLRDIERIATPEDIAKAEKQQIREAEAFKICEEKIAQHGLPMHLLSAELSFDESVITFNFSSEGRVDFRELVRDVAGAIHLKVQLMQIGVRDEAKLLGGYGSCGRQLCCNLFLSSFDTVSMKMAKDQSLFLNPAKFSGCCGKLMCCLKYENDFYSSMQNALPVPGSYILTEKGPSKIREYNYLSGTVILIGEEGNSFTLPIAGINLQGVCKKHGIHTENCTDECKLVDIEELKKLGVMDLPVKDTNEAVPNIPNYEGSTSISFDFPDENAYENEKKSKQKKSKHKHDKGDKQPKKPKGGAKPFTMGGEDSPDLGIVFRDLKEESAPKKKKKHSRSRKSSHDKQAQSSDTKPETKG